MDVFIKPWIILFNSYAIAPTIALVKEIAQGPVCAFYPESFLCNLTLEIMK